MRVRKIVFNHAPVATNSIKALQQYSIKAIMMKTIECNWREVLVMEISRGNRCKINIGRKVIEIDEVDRALAEFMPYVEDIDLILDAMERVYSWKGDKKALVTLSNRFKAIRAGLRDLGYNNIPFKRYTELTDIRNEGGKDYE